MKRKLKRLHVLVAVILAGWTAHGLPAAFAQPAKTDFAGPTVGKLTPGDGVASKDPGDWPQFRGPQRDAIAHDAKGLYRAWPAEGPKALWTIEGLGAGYSGPAVFGGKVYFHDYDSKNKLWMCRCVSLADGKEIWRWAYERDIEPSHGITRTIPAVDGKYVISFDPKCVLHGFDAATGKRLWARDFLAEYGVKNPQWYNGQCPLNEPDRVILGIGGGKRIRPAERRESERREGEREGESERAAGVLMAAFDKATGKPLWQTPNPEHMQMAHDSVMPMTLGGRKQYVWCTLDGLVGVDAADGRLLWRGPVNAEGQLAWQPHTAIAPSPVAFGGDRVFMTSSYKSGSVMFKVQEAEGGYVPLVQYTRTFEDYASDCHTAVLFQDRLFAVSREKFTCLDPAEGKIVWSSPDGLKFGLGSFLLADGLFFILEGDTGKLHLVEASTESWKELATCQVLSGHDVWAPMALVNGKFILRDLGKMVCLQVGPSAATTRPD